MIIITIMQLCTGADHAALGVNQSTEVTQAKNFTLQLGHLWLVGMH
jgi:hypothetical protein